MNKPVQILISVATLCALPFFDGCQVREPANLVDGFRNPPPAARPWVYWFWLNGNITAEGITADLEAMKRVGIGGVLIMEVDQGAPKGPVAFAGQEWRELFKFVCAEANRLGLEVNMNNDAGWCGSGGPWITPDLGMQKIVFSETNVEGSRRFDGTLSRPSTTVNYYRDIAVLAFPTPLNDLRIETLPGKSALVPQHFASPASWPEFTQEHILVRDQVVNLTAQMDSTGRLTWNIPDGRWTILRLGHTPTGKDNHPAPESGRGWESDKLSKAATDAMFEGLMAKLVADVKPFVGKTLMATHIDSWETGSQNWTPRFREEFQKRRGYDLLMFLPVMTGRVIESVAISERFLWDIRLTVSDLLIENYAGRFRELAHDHGLRLSIEAYDDAPCAEMNFAGQADEPMAEFWAWGNQTPYSCTEMTSAAHVYGKRIIGAEAFTATDGEKWLLHPASVKGLGDWAFCEGINRFVFHRYALQPWRDQAPGMSMGPWGLHYERTQTWWEQSSAWHQYLSRCQFLLQQGLFVADICYLQPEGSPRRFSPTLPGYTGNTPERPCYNFDGCTPEVLITAMKVKDGRLVLPDGMSYRLLVLAQLETMTPALLKKIKELVLAGATVLGPPPSASPSLANYPTCDAEVRQLASDLWGKPESVSYTGNLAEGERRVGKGRVIWSDAFTSPILKVEAQSPLKNAKWIWFAAGNPADAAAVGKCFFRRRLFLEAGHQIASAHLLITADNSFEMWVNGRLVGSGANAGQTTKLDIAQWLKPGENQLAVAAENAHEYPNPAGLIARLLIRFKDGDTLEVYTDRKWESAMKVQPHWRTKGDTQKWRAAMELGPLGMRPFPIPDVFVKTPIYVFPKFAAIANVLGSMGVPPDFEADSTFRYIHRRTADMDFYFISNRTNEWHGANCGFRVSNQVPELWNPLTGEIRRQVIYKEQEGRTFLPLWLEPNGSIFVVFRTKANSRTRIDRVVAVEYNGANVLPDNREVLCEPPSFEMVASMSQETILRAWQPGRYDLKTENNIQTIDIRALPTPIEISGPWQVSFEQKQSAAKILIFDKLHSWSEHNDPEVRYFSGSATYRINFVCDSKFKNQNLRMYLDLGRVAVIAEAKLNGKELGILWRPPFRVDVTEELQPDDNVLEVKVTNLWVNRQIGDEQLAEDSDRNKDGTLKSWPQWLQANGPSPTGRYSFTSWRLWKKGDTLIESGLLGPVKLFVAKDVALK